MHDLQSKFSIQITDVDPTVLVLGFMALEYCIRLFYKFKFNHKFWPERFHKIGPSFLRTASFSRAGQERRRGTPWQGINFTKLHFGRKL
jgi:hypothetical protein